MLRKIHFAGIVLLTVYGGASVFADRPAAIVILAAGEREIIQTGQHLDLEAQDLVYAGDIIETGKDGKVSVQSSSGVIFQIGTDAIVKIGDLAVTGTGSSLLIDLQRGSVAASVAHGSGSHDVRITTPTATASVRGTEFLVEADEEETSILVEEGEIEVEDRMGGRARARAGRIMKARRLQKMMESIMDDSHRRRLRVLEEFRSRRDSHFQERLEKIRAGRQRIRRIREGIRDNARENIRNRREDRRR